MTHATVRYLFDGGIEISSPYSPAFVEELKDAIPYTERKWISERKVWTVTRYFVEMAITVVRRHYDDVEIVTFEQERAKQSSPPPSSSLTDPFRTLHLLPTAPTPLIDAAFKTLARIYHPDLGGDTITMQRLNAAYDKLKGSRR